MAMLDEPVNTLRLLGSDTHADVIATRWGDEEGSVDDGGRRLASHIPFFFLCQRAHCISLCVLHTSALVILVTYRG